jgi:hypothetical protein
VRKGDVQEPMRKRPGSAVGFAGGFDFHTERGIKTGTPATHPPSRAEVCAMPGVLAP